VTERSTTGDRRTNHARYGEMQKRQNRLRCKTANIAQVLAQIVMEREQRSEKWRLMLRRGLSAHERLRDSIDSVQWTSTGRTAAYT